MNQEKQDKTNKMFTFMLKEYEMLYSKFEMHYNAVEKTIALYFIIVGAVISANSILLSQDLDFSLFELSSLQIGCSFFIIVLGYILSLKVVEHRLLIITYVKNLNLNRKWFNDNIADHKISQYSIFKVGTESPKYYKKYRHFYWEALGLAIINSIFLGVFLVNIISSFEFFKHQNSAGFNWIWIMIISLIGTLVFMRYYKKRATEMENNLTN